MNVTKFRVISPAPHGAWIDLLNNRIQNLIFATPQWMDCITEVEDMQNASRFYEFSNGKKAIIPLARRKTSFLSSSIFASMPHGWGMGGLITWPNLDKNEMLAILNDLRDLEHLQVSIRPNPIEEYLWKKVDFVFDSTTEHSTHILDISNGFEHFWSKVLNSSTRNKIRKGENSGLVVECDETGKAIDEFYQIYMRWTDNRARERKIPLIFSRWLARKREPLEKFRVVNREFGSRCQIWTAKLNRVLVSVAILLIHNAHAYYWRSYSDKFLTRSTRANELLQKFMVEEACKQGCIYYHMGESGGVPSLIHYKEKFGAAQFSCREYHLEKFPVTKIQQVTNQFLSQFERYMIKRLESNHGN